MAESKGCGSCGPVADRVLLIQKVSEQIAGAHMALANMYEQLSQEQAIPEEKLALVSAANNQRELATRSTFVTVPDLIDSLGKENAFGQISELPLPSGSVMDSPFDQR